MRTLLFYFSIGQTVTLSVDLFPAKKYESKIFTYQIKYLTSNPGKPHKIPPKLFDANCSCLGPITVKVTLNWSSKRIKEMIKKVFDVCDAGERLVFSILPVVRPLK